MGDVSQSSFITWSTKCIVDYGYNSTTVDTNAHTAAASAAHVLASNVGDTAWLVISIVAIVLGLVFTFVGYEAFYLTLALVAFVTGSSFAFGMLCGLTNSAIAAVIVGLIFGIILAVVLTKFERAGVMLCGITGGIVAYMFFNGFFMHYLYNAVPDESKALQTAIPIMVLILLGCIGGTLAVLLERPMVIGVTALGGAYATLWAADRLIFKSSSNHLNPVVLVAGGGCHSWECYIILVAMLVLAMLGVVVQWRRTEEDCEHEGPMRRFSKPKFAPHGYNNMENAGCVEEGNGAMLSGQERRLSREFR